jgi:CTP synthase
LQRDILVPDPSAKKATKYIFVTGGVVSSLGKGIASASLGRLLESRGLVVSLQKFDPYLNVDPGTMSPFQHGEVYVLDDGSETDLDLGYYERFTHTELDKDSSVTTGKVYSTVINKERKGVYLGKTVQVIPHITDEIKARIQKGARGGRVDVVITEIGGTVGDIEGQPFLEAIRQFKTDVGKQNVLYIHLTLIPTIRVSGEVKTKPTQHSVHELMEAGIQPDILVFRTEQPLTQSAREKLALFCNVSPRAIIQALDVATSIYEVPLDLKREGLDDLVVESLGLEASVADLREWEQMVEVIRHPHEEVEIAVVGKYLDLSDSYRSIFDSLSHGGVANRAKVIIRKVDSERIEKEDVAKVLAGVHGVLIPGGFGHRGIQGKNEAVQYAREGGIPFFGICLGMQCAVIEFARNVCGLERANSTEFDSSTPHPVIDIMPEQIGVDLGGTMRLGAYPCQLAAGSKAKQAYEVGLASERHRHRYELNNAYRETLEHKGLWITGVWPHGNLAEIIELPDHPWFVGVQFHPEFKSRPTRAHPLFREFVRASLAHLRRQVQSPAGATAA